MEQWTVALIAAAGVLGQWLVSSRASARRDGVVDEKIRAHDARLDKHRDEISDLREAQADDRNRLIVVETRLGQRAR